MMRHYISSSFKMASKIMIWDVFLHPSNLDAKHASNPENKEINPRFNPRFVYMNAVHRPDPHFNSMVNFTDGSLPYVDSNPTPNPNPNPSPTTRCRTLTRLASARLPRTVQGVGYSLNIKRMRETVKTVP